MYISLLHLYIIPFLIFDDIDMISSAFGILFLVIWELVYIGLCVKVNLVSQ